MLTANKARIKSKKSIDKYLKQELRDVESRIKDATRYGICSITICEEPHPTIKQKLEELGYVIEPTCSRSNYYVKW